MSKYKLIATDFDGTLLNDKKKVSLENLNSLKKGRDLNFFLVGVTARTSGSVFSIVDKNLFDYFILNNGTHLYDVKKEELTPLFLISEEYYKKIFYDMKEVCSEIDFCSGTVYYIYGNDKVKKPFIKNIDNIENLEDVGRMNLFLLEQDKIDYYCKVINERYNDIDCFVMQESNDDYKWLVLLPKGVSKFSSLLKLGDKLNVTKEEIVAFGDGPNDVEVISNVGCGVAMGNAVPMLKEVAKNITKNNNESGVSYFLENEILK